MSGSIGAVWPNAHRRGAQVATALVSGTDMNRAPAAVDRASYFGLNPKTFSP
jgi:hypothetical protein